MAINDALPLKAARRDVIANFKWRNFDVYIYIQYAAPPYSARIIAIYFFPFGNVWLGSVSACNAWELNAEFFRNMGENSDRILSRL